MSGEALGTSDSVIFTIDYALDLATMISLGRYDWVNEKITSQGFPIIGEGIVTVRAMLFNFDHILVSEDVNHLMEFIGYEAAKIEHLLAYGAKYPDEQRNGPIIGLGSVVEEFEDYRSSPRLDYEGLRRHLHLCGCQGLWGSSYRFLGVHRIS